MPTGKCRYPDHHSPSAGPPLGLLAAIALGAVIIGAWHTIIVALIVVAILASIAGAVFLLIHNHGSGYDPELERQALASEVQRNAAAQLAASQQRAIKAPAVHNHLHLHGLSAVEVAELAASQREFPMITQADQPW